MAATTPINATLRLHSTARYSHTATPIHPSQLGPPIREPGRPIIGDQALGLGYGYQWWLPAGDRGEFSAIGVYNQFVFVDPASRTTIVKLSANRRYGTSTAESDNRDDENIVVLQAIARNT